MSTYGRTAIQVFRDGKKRKKKEKEEIWAISFFKQKFLTVKNMCIFLRVKAGFPIRFWLGFVHTCSLLLAQRCCWSSGEWTELTSKPITSQLGHLFTKYLVVWYMLLNFIWLLKLQSSFGTNVSCQWWYKYFNLKKKNFLRKNILPKIL